MVRAKQSVSVNEIAGERILNDLAAALDSNNLVVIARLLGLCEALQHTSGTGGYVLLKKGEEQEKEVADVIASADKYVHFMVLKEIAHVLIYLYTHMI